MNIELKAVPESKDLFDYPDDTRFYVCDSTPRYILEPFEIISPDDPRYKDALTRKEIEEKVRAKFVNRPFE